MILTNEYIELIKLQRPYIQGNTNDEIFVNYIKDIELDYDDIKEYLVKSTTLVDIGGGMAGIDYMIKLHNSNIQISVLDGVKVEPGEHYGYRDNIAFYSNNSIAEHFFYINNIDITFFPADPNLIIKCDTLISLNSWGFHYPLDCYRIFLDNNSSTINTVIFDARIRYQGLELLEKYGFNYNKVIRTWGSKKQRIVFSKQPIAAYAPSNDRT
jgi:hypothetical protein